MSWAIWVTGPPGSGKSTVVRHAVARLETLGEPVTVLELDEIRKVITPEPAYSDQEREVVYRSLVFMAMSLAESGLPVIVDATAHRRAWRDMARARIRRFVEVQLRCPLEVCRDREAHRHGGHAPRGIYARAGLPGAGGLFDQTILLDDLAALLDPALASLQETSVELAPLLPPVVLPVSGGDQPVGLFLGDLLATMWAAPSAEEPVELLTVMMLSPEVGMDLEHHHGPDGAAFTVELGEPELFLHFLQPPESEEIEKALRRNINSLIPALLPTLIESGTMLSLPALGEETLDFESFVADVQGG